MSRAPFAPVKPRQPGSPKACVSALYAEAGGAKMVAVRLVLGLSQVHAYSDPQAADEISFARVAALTSAATPAAAEYLAALAGGGFLPGGPPGEADAQALTSESVRQHGEAIAQLVTHLRDGILTAAEAQSALPDLDDAVRALLGLRALLLERAQS